MTPLRPCLACVIEQALNLGRYGRHNGGVKEYIQTAEQEHSDDNGDENLYAGIDITLCFLASDSCFDPCTCCHRQRYSCPPYWLRSHGRMRG